MAGPPDSVTVSAVVPSTEATKRKIKRIFRPYLKVPPALFNTEILQKLMLDRTRARFESKGKNPGAQKDPRRTPWRPLKYHTIRSGGDPDRMLFRTGALRDSIIVIKDTFSAAMYTNTGGGFRIGVDESSQAGAYARVQNYGGKVGKYGTRIPARRFIGIGHSDKLAVNKLLKGILKEQGL